jgi:excisionase family DNA binding protein
MPVYTTAPTMTPAPSRCFSVRQVARLFGVCPNTVRHWVAQGRFPAPLRLSRRKFLFRREDVEAVLGDSLDVPPARAGKATATTTTAAARTGPEAAAKGGSGMAKAGQRTTKAGMGKGRRRAGAKRR